MEVEDEYKLLQRLFFKKYGRALPEKKSDDVDIEMDPKDLTEEQKKMEAIPSLAQSTSSRRSRSKSTTRLKPWSTKSKRSTR